MDNSENYPSSKPDYTKKPANEVNPITQEQATEILKKNKTEVNYNQIVGTNTQILFLGESHGINASKDELIENMGSIHEAGITYLALEMFPSEFQKYLDAYIQADPQTQEARTALFAINAALRMNGWTHTKDALDQYRNVIEEAKKAKLKVIGLDKKMENDDYTSDEAMRERNTHWDGVLSNLFETDPEARVVVFCGSDHLRRNMPFPSIAALQETHGRQITSAIYMGGEDRALSKQLTAGLSPNNNHAIDDSFEDASQQLGIEKEKFMVSLDAMGDQKPADYFIHLPQTEDPSLLKMLFGKSLPK